MEPLVSVAELETYLQRTLDADVGAMAVANASGIVRDFARWIIAPAEDVTFTLNGNGGTTLDLPTLYLTEVTEVRVFGDVLEAPTEDGLAGAYRWGEEGQLDRVDGWVWPRVKRCIEVDVSHAYAVTPDAVKAVTFVLASRVASNPEGLRSKTVGAVSRSFVFETMRGDLSELQMSQIGGFRLP